MRYLALAAVLLLAAGCLSPSGSVPQPPGAAQVDPAEAAPTLLPPQRVAVSQMRLHESVDPRLADFPATRDVETLPDRDVNVTYAGIHNVLDEFARPVPAYVFRYAARSLHVETDNEGNPVSAKYVTSEVEYPFAVSNGRLMGLVDVAAGVHAFMTPASRYFYTGDQALAVMVSVVLGGDFSKEAVLTTVANHTYYLRFEPSDLHPLPGDCKAYSPAVRVDPPLPPARPKAIPSKPVAPENVTHDLLCFQDGQQMPLWSYRGSVGHGAAITTRLSDSFALPPLHGTPLAPVAYKLAPWMQVPLVSPLAGQALAPPSSKAGDWADRIAARVQALESDPNFHAFNAAPPLGSNAPSAVDLAWIGLPSGTLLAPAGLPIDALLSLSKPSSVYFGEVYRVGDGPTGPTYAAQPTVPVAGVSSISSASVHPAMPAAGDVQAQLAPVVPTSGMLLFWSFQVEGYAPFATWFLVEPCAANGGLFAVVDGTDGHVQVAMQSPAGAPGCQALAVNHLPVPPVPVDEVSRIMDPKPWQAFAPAPSL